MTATEKAQWEDGRVDSMADQIEEMLLERGPVYKNEIMNEFNQDRAYAIMALNEEHFFEDDVGRVHLGIKRGDEDGDG